MFPDLKTGNKYNILLLTSHSQHLDQKNSKSSCCVALGAVCIVFTEQMGDTGTKQPDNGGKGNGNRIFTLLNL